MTNARLENFALNLLLTIKKENVEKTGNRLRKINNLLFWKFSGGTKNNITQCIYQICCVMLESPPKGTTIPYTPKAGFLSGGGLGPRPRSGGGDNNPLASLLNLGGGGASTLAAIASLAGSQIRDNRRDRDREDRSGGSGNGGGTASTSFEM